MKNKAFHHNIAQDSKALLKYQDEILECLGDDGSHVFHFCSSGAEAINSAFFSHYFENVRKTGQNHIIAPELEVGPIVHSMQRLEEYGCSIKTIPLNAQGQLTQEIVHQAIKPRTGLLSLSWAHGLTGVVQPIADIAQVCKEKNVALHVDASHILGKLYFRLEDYPIDFFTFQLPHHAGGLIIDKAMPYTPLIAGQSAPPLAGMAALSQALFENARACDHLCLETARLRNKLEQGITSLVPEAVILFEHVERLPNCTAIAFPHVFNEALLFLLHRSGVYATIGDGYQSLPQSALSFSLSFETTEEEIDYAIETIATCVQRLTACSARLFEG